MSYRYFHPPEEDIQAVDRNRALGRWFPTVWSLVIVLITISILSGSMGASSLPAPVSITARISESINRQWQSETHFVPYKFYSGATSIINVYSPSPVLLISRSRLFHLFNVLPVSTQSLASAHSAPYRNMIWPAGQSYQGFFNPWRSIFRFSLQLGLSALCPSIFTNAPCRVGSDTVSPPYHDNPSDFRNPPAPADKSVPHTA